jgi:hypothetical protein
VFGWAGVCHTSGLTYVTLLGWVDVVFNTGQCYVGLLMHSWVTLSLRG